MTDTAQVDFYLVWYDINNNSQVELHGRELLIDRLKKAQAGQPAQGQAQANVKHDEPEVRDMGKHSTLHGRDRLLAALAERK